MPNLTPEQHAIIEHMADPHAGHLVIDAKAGSGKTSTLLEGLSRLHGSTLFMAFNRSIADEIKAKASRRISFEQSLQTDISTVHSHGLRSFKRAGMHTKTLSGKVSFMLKDLVERSYSKDDDIYRNLGKVTRLVSAAKVAGFLLESVHEQFPSGSRRDWEALAEHYNIEEDLAGDTDLDEVIDLAQQLLRMSNQRTNSIDFDDMIYLPLLLNLTIPQYDNVLIDEAQDINATRRELAFRSIKPGGRIIAVGDPNQAIYGFTGADVASLFNITNRAKATVLPLTICWRCDRRIILSAQEQVPTIQPKPGADDGQVLELAFEHDDFLSLPQPGDAILCRVNKPNVACCLGLIRRGVPAKIEGRDLGQRLEFHATKAAPLYAHQALEDTLLELETYKEAEVGRLVAKNKSESAITLLEDEIDAASLVLERAIELRQPETAHDNQWPLFMRVLNELFGDDLGENVVVLSSVHKAKGREWPRVFILGYRDWMPHKMAKMAWEQEQEQNLIYVAKTRAERALVFVNGAQSAIDRGIHRKQPKKEPVG